jgi:RNase P subunit RPR2
MTCVCEYCNSVIEYDNSDLRLALGAPNEIYITCPVCGKPITVGVSDEPIFEDFYQNYDMEWF